MLSTKLSPLFKKTLVLQNLPDLAQRAPQLASWNVRILPNRFLCDNKGDNVVNEPRKLVKLKKSGEKNKSSYLRVYTRTGDSGKSSLYTGERRSKNDPIFEALGTIDELSSTIGLSIEYCNMNSHPYGDQLQRVQCLLQDIGSALATPESSAREAHTAKSPNKFNARHTKELEEWIDDYSEHLPPLENFILPGGGITSASLHVSRSICRRAERQIATLKEKTNDVDPEILKYVNRLSDFLFTIARFAARVDKKEETIYRRIEEESPYVSGPDGIWKKVKKEEKREDN